MIKDNGRGMESRRSLSTDGGSDREKGGSIERNRDIEGGEVLDEVESEQLRLAQDASAADEVAIEIRDDISEVNDFVNLHSANLTPGTLAEIKEAESGVEDLFEGLNDLHDEKAVLEKDVLNLETQPSAEEEYEAKIVWYKKAKNKVDSFIHEIDPDLSVHVADVDVTYFADPDVQQKVTVLKFEHPTDPNLRWTMEVGEDDEYIDGRLEEIVRNITTQQELEGRTYTEEPKDFFESVQTKTVEGMLDNEKEKSPEVLELIGEVDRLTNMLRQELGLPDITVPPEAIHIIMNQEWHEAGSGFFDERSNQVFLAETVKMTILRKKLLHEVMHMKSKNIFPTQLNEALIEQATKLLMSADSESQGVNQELEMSAELIASNPNHLDLSGDKLFNEDTIIAYVGGEGNMYTEAHTYPQERKSLRILTEKIHANNQGKFSSPQEVFVFLLTSNMKGDESGFGLIDESFGAGSLERMTQLDADPAGLLSFIESL